MADEADLTQARLEREEALRRRTPPAPILPYCGQCYWCGEALPPTRRWCDADCRDDWERDHARRRTRA